MNSDPSLQDAIRQYACEAQPFLENINKLLSNLKGMVFFGRRIDLPENLNDYVRYEMTLRTPAASTQDATVFYRTNMRKKDITVFLNSCAPSNQIEIDENKWISKLKTRLVETGF